VNPACRGELFTRDVLTYMLLQVRENPLPPARTASCAWPRAKHPVLRTHNVSDQRVEVLPRNDPGHGPVGKLGKASCYIAQAGMNFSRVLIVHADTARCVLAVIM